MPKDRVCATDTVLPICRRDMLTMLPVAPVAMSLALKPDRDALDPVVAQYRIWLDARREWLALADLPGNEDWDDPRSLAALEREKRAQERMLTLTPVSLEGIAAMAALAWAVVNPGTTDPDEFARDAQESHLRAITAIWKAGTGRDGYPKI